MANLGDVSKINLPNGNVVNIKDTTARTQANWNTNNGVKNLLNFDADTMKSVNTGGIWSGNTWSLGNNVTLTINSDKSITLNGTANAGKTVYLTKNLGMAKNTYTLSTGALRTKLWAGLVEVGGTENNYTGSTTHVDKTCQPNHITLYIESGCVLSNLTVYPMLTLKSLYDADSTYEPYALPNTKITPELIELVDSGAKNLYNPSNTSTSSSGLTGTVTRNSDGSYTISGTTSGTVYYLMGTWITPEDGFYILSGGSAAESASQLIYDDHDWQTYESGNKKKLAYWSKGSTHSLYIRLGSGITLSNVTFYPMICTKAAWDVSQKYVPYAPTNAELYAMIQALQS